jgi:hypothetical protein
MEVAQTFNLGIAPKEIDADAGTSISPTSSLVEELNAGW